MKSMIIVLVCCLLVGMSVSQCPENCVSCNNPLKLCESCAEGFYINTSNQCLSCRPTCPFSCYLWYGVVICRPPPITTATNIFGRYRIRNNKYPSIYLDVQNCLITLIDEKSPDIQDHYWIS